MSTKAFVLHLDVSFDKSLFYTFTCAFVQHLNLSVYVHIQEPVLHLHLYATYKSFVLHLDVPFY